MPQRLLDISTVLFFFFLFVCFFFYKAKVLTEPVVSLLQGFNNVSIEKRWGGGRGYCHIWAIGMCRCEG